MNNLCKTLIIKQLKKEGGVNLRSKLLHILYPRQGQWARSWIFLCLPGYWDSHLASFLLPLAPSQRGKREAGENLVKDLAENPQPVGFPL